VPFRGVQVKISNVRILNGNHKQRAVLTTEDPKGNFDLNFASIFDLICLTFLL
jgi:hypothetical protein